MHTRIIPEETESVETENQSGFEIASFDIQGLLVKMQKLVQEQLDDDELFEGEFRNFNRIAKNYATRIYIWIVIVKIENKVARPKKI